MGENEIGNIVVDAALAVHTALGAGLLESAYEACVQYELAKRRLQIRSQVQLPIVYGEIRLEAGYRVDLVVEERVIVEVKAVERLLPIHTAQVLSYLEPGNYRLGYLQNFNVEPMRSGIKRVANGL